MFKKDGQITYFEIAAKDIPERLHVPEKLYGREMEIEYLVKSFNKVCKTGNKSVLFFSGAPGIGKSSLINEIQQPVIKKKGSIL